MRITCFTLFTILSLSLPLSGQKIWIEPSGYQLDDTVTVYVDLKKCQKEILLGYDSLFFWSSHPAWPTVDFGKWTRSSDAVAMRSEGDDVWSYTLVPTEFYGVDSTAFLENEWWFLVKARNGGTGFGTVRYETEYMGLIRRQVIPLEEPGNFRRGFTSKQYRINRLDAGNMVLPDPNKALSIEEAMAAYDKGAFRYPDLMEDASYMEKPFWQVTRVKNESDETHKYTISVGNISKSWNEIDIYIRDSADSLTYYRSGFEVPLKEKAMDDWRNMFPIELAPGETKQIFVRVADYASHELMPEVEFLYQMDYDHMERMESGYKIPFAFMASVLGFVILFYLLWFLMTRKREQAYYALLWTGFLLSVVIPSPIGYYFAINELFPIIKNFFDLSMAWLLMSTLSLWGILGFSVHYLDLPTYYPRAVKWAKVLAVLPLLIFAVGVVNFFFPSVFPYDPYSWEGFFYFPSTILRSFLLGIAFLFAFSMGIYVHIKGFKPARYFLIAFLPLTVAAVLVSMSNMRMAFQGEAIGLPASFNTINNITMILALILFALAMGYKQKKLEKDHNEAQEELLKTQKKSIEEQRRVNERLRQMDALKDQFLANTSHELRTPLNGIIGLSEALIDQEGDREKQENLSMIISSGKRLSSLVNDILDFSKLKNSEIELRRRPVDLQALVDVVLRIHRPLIAGKELQLINAIPHDLPPVLADEDRVQQILFNLVGNAAKFTETGFVKVGAMTKADSITVFVEDTGIGIPENKREAIFQAFEQADGSIQREFAGTGLGLTISKQLVALHGGEMWVESEVGKGSKFFFSLPISGKAAISRAIFETPNDKMREVPVVEPGVMISSLSSASSQSSPSQDTLIPPHRDTGQIRILVVDDEPINQQVFKSHLSREHYQITKAMNGEEALQILESDATFDLVLLDVMMPRMSGYEVCQKIREKYLPSELPVIMVTAKNQIADLVQGLHTGANDYIAKPFSKEEFLARIKTHLNLHQINTVTNRFVPTAFIRSLGKNTLTELKLGDQVEREVTVFFSDIRDYTGLAETMTPAQNFRFVNAYAGRMGPIIQENGGFVNQYLGDGIMSIFQDKPDGALQAAVAMQQTVSTYNGERRTLDRRELSVGMGLHTGSLIMGIIGDRQRTDAATISDTVNTASRMEGLTKIFGARILISEDTFRSLSSADTFHFRYLGQVKVKGRKELVGVYECFDGDSAEEIEAKFASLSPFAEAIDHYYAQRFSKAIFILEELSQHAVEDRVARYFYQQATQFLAHGAPAEWTGTSGSH